MVISDGEKQPMMSFTTIDISCACVSDRQTGKLTQWPQARKNCHNYVHFTDSNFRDRNCTGSIQVTWYMYCSGAKSQNRRTLATMYTGLDYSTWVVLV